MQGAAVASACTAACLLGLLLRVAAFVAARPGDLPEMRYTVVSVLHAYGEMR